ncbi:TetR/AcrR family transcriptional regulator [Leifsonia shinshuensis]|uniref:Helix-turn-helix transcriptional regulator n=1 Tax=Leifsonia shinshuensis TaxID=150026 RepID=A0A7G6YBG5_9MICO|nr:TetR/AcrR family transcriptional regulator [Leifsonia shinshuensis]QNE35830.1 helix-turn-helix transcriptional regulator [Leifsonia shinshuensis]
MKSEPVRPYRMVARAESAAATAERIMDAYAELFTQRPSDQIGLDQVAALAGVTVQTVLRRFGSKEKLFAATTKREAGRVRDDRFTVTPGDVAGAVANLIDHYEEMGDLVMRMLGEEERVPAIKEITDNGRRLHRDWCEKVFAPFLPPAGSDTGDRRRAQFVAICDVYTWKLLRRDSALSRRRTEAAIVEMLAPFTKEPL